MIKYIKKDPLFKKSFIVMLSFMILISVMLMVINYYELKSFYNKQMEITQGLVGTFVNQYPEDEIKILDSLLNKDNVENIALGKDILDKYGYSQSLSINNNESFSRTFKSFMVQNAAQCIFLIIVVSAIFLFIIRYIAKDLMEFCNSAEKIMNGDLSVQIDNNKEGLLSTLRSQFHQMANRLKLNVDKLNKEKESMKSIVTDMSHQLKTPVASMKLSTSLLSENDLSDDEQQEFLEKCNEDIDKLDWLISSLIKMSRLEVGIIEIKKEKYSIKETIIKAANGVYIKALDKNIEINMENLHDEIIEHDIKWTKEALTNILENAVKYTPNGGSIKITTCPLAALFKVDIEDTGIGIPKEEINNIFKKFYRGHSKEVTEADGLGVGLYLTRKIIEEQGGSIIVHSVQGKGSRFSVFLQK